MKDNQIDIILNKGKEITTEIAKKKYEEVVKKIGLGR